MPKHSPLEALKLLMLPDGKHIARRWWTVYDLGVLLRMKYCLPFTKRKILQLLEDAKADCQLEQRESEEGETEYRLSSKSATSGAKAGMLFDTAGGEAGQD